MKSSYLFWTFWTWLKNDPLHIRSQNSSAWSTIAIYFTLETTAWFCRKTCHIRIYYETNAWFCRKTCHIRIYYVAILGKRDVLQEYMHYHIAAITKTGKCLSNISRNIHLPQNWSTNSIFSRFVRKIILWQTWKKGTCLKRGKYISSGKTWK